MANNRIKSTLTFCMKMLCSRTVIEIWTSAINHAVISVLLEQYC